MPPPFKHGLNHKGYPRFTRGPNRFRYKHRVAAEEAVREWNYYGWCSIPEGFHVHHMDLDKTHYCRGNLLIVEACLHASAMPRCPYTGRFLPRPSRDLDPIGLDM